VSGGDAGAVLLRLVRNGVVESVHRGHVVVCSPDGEVVAALGVPDRSTYVRSAVKPFQALAVLEMLTEAGIEMDVDALAIACASHDGTDAQQIETARLLAEAGLDESALQCPPAMPRDVFAQTAQRTPTSLAHNCSGKHAGFLWATVAGGHDPAAYLEVASPIQSRARDRLEDACGAVPQGPGIDGCGAPAYLLPLSALATGFARLAAGASPPLTRARDAMRARPLLVGGPHCVDTALMRADSGVVAKRGAEAVFAAGVLRGDRSLGVAVKIEDGGARADGPVAATLLRALGYTVPDEVARPTVLGGGRPQGFAEVDPAVSALI
jgi:L-asparaginase II